MTTTPQMKAVVVKQYGPIDNFELVNYTVSPPPKGYVCVKIKASAFNPVDYKIRQGRFGGSPPTEGAILGADFAGVIQSVGEGVAQYKPGDEVYGMALGFGTQHGIYCELVTLSENLIAKKPSSLSFEDAASLPIPALTALHCVNKAQIKKEHSVLVTGASGGVGSVVVQLLRHIGSTVVTTCGSDQSKEYIHKQLQVPADHIVKYSGLSDTDLTKAVIAANGGKDFDVTIDLFGGSAKILCFNAVKLEGQIVTIVEEEASFQTPLWPSQSPSNLFSKGATLHAVFVAAPALTPEPTNWAKIHDGLASIAQLTADGAVKPPKIEVVGNLSAETVKKAHQLLEAHHTTGKLVMKVE